MQIIPQYSLRGLLGLTAAAAVVFSIAGLAVRGHAWAIGVTAAFGALAVMTLVYGLMFTAVWLFSLTLSKDDARLQRSSGASPGADSPLAQPFAADEVIVAAVVDRPADRGEGERL